MGFVETFEHTADLGLRIEAESLERLFQTGARGLFQIIVANLESVLESDEREVSLEADTMADLFADWLSELIFLSETGHSLYSRFDVTLERERPRLRATIAGEPIDTTRHVLDHEVKAVTRHGLLLEHRDGAWTAEVILDI